MAPTDLSDFLAYQTHPESLEFVPNSPMTEEKAAGFLARQVTLEIGDGDGYLALAVELRETGRLIGEVGIGFSAHTPEKGELGWSIHPEFQGHGYATEAAQILLAYAFREKNLHRVTAGCDTRNIASWHLM